MARMITILPVGSKPRHKLYPVMVTKLNNTVVHAHYPQIPQPTPPPLRESLPLPIIPINRRPPAYKIDSRARLRRPGDLHRSQASKATRRGGPLGLPRCRRRRGSRPRRSGEKTRKLARGGRDWRRGQGPQLAANATPPGSRARHVDAAFGFVCGEPRARAGGGAPRRTR